MIVVVELIDWTLVWLQQCLALEPRSQRQDELRLEAPAARQQESGQVSAPGLCPGARGRGQLQVVSSAPRLPPPPLPHATDPSRRRQPSRLAVALTRRSRRYSTPAKAWEPSLRNPYRGLVIWPPTDAMELVVTLFRDQRSQEYEDKEWALVVEDVASGGRRRQVCQAMVSLSRFVASDGDSSLPSQHEVTKLRLHASSKKLQEAHITFSVSCQFLKEGKAT